MGLTRKPVLVKNLESGQTLVLTALVDSGATWTALPLADARALGLRSMGTRPLQLADGTMVTWEYGYIEVTAAGRSGATICVYSDRVAEPMLGVHALEGLGLALDPVSEELVPVPGRLGGFLGPL